MNKHLISTPPNKFIVYSKIPYSIFHKNEINIYFHKITSVNQYNRMILKYSMYKLEIDVNINTFDANRIFLNNLRFNNIIFTRKSYHKIRIHSNDYNKFINCLYNMFTIDEV